MPWVPELFTAPALEQLLERRRRDRLVWVPFFDGLLVDEPEALLASFAGEPELHHPVLGRVKGAPAFSSFIDRMSAWLAERHVEVEDVSRVILDQHGFEEVLLHLDGPGGRVALPFAVVADHPVEGRLDELRIYFSGRPLTGRHASRPPLRQHDPGLSLPDVVAEHGDALAAGDVDAVLATFEPQRGPELRAFYERRLAVGGMLLETCGIVDDGQICAVEHNLTRWGIEELPPQAGLSVHVRGPSGRLAAVRVYDDVDPSLVGRTSATAPS